MSTKEEEEEDEEIEILEKKKGKKEEDEEKEVSIDKSLGLDWVFGMNKDLTEGVHYIGDETSKEIFYVAGHVGVIYNFETHTQRLLQGHTNGISCVCVSTDSKTKYIVTADAGNENMIVIWDSKKGIPIKTIFNPHKFGSQSVDISHDNQLIVSLSYPFIEDEETEEEIPLDEQTLSIYKWQSSRSSPVYSSIITGNESKPQLIIRFHPTNPSLLVSNSIRRVMFWSTEEKKLKFYSPPLSKTDFRKPVGEFTQSTFIPNTTMAATSTKNGEIVLWQQVASDKNEKKKGGKGGSSNQVKQTDKKALKVVQVHKSPITFLKTVENKYIVTGGMDGFVRFFDYQLRLQAWFEEFDAGPICSISFQRKKKLSSSGSGSDLDSISSIMDEKDDEDDEENTKGRSDDEFKCSDFVVGTSLALILYVKAKSFDEYENLKGVLLVQGQEGPIQCLAVHPSKPYLAISGLSGHLHLWDYEKKQVLSLTMFQRLLITCIAFDPRGHYLVVGCTNGVIKILEVKKFDEIQSFNHSNQYIQKIQFSHDSKFFAFSDLDNCIGIFKWTHRDEDERCPIEWVYIGKCQSHKFGSSKVENRLRIADFQFGVKPYSNVPRLLSLGEDRRLVEYDLEESCIFNGIKVTEVHKIGQSAHPTAFLWTRAQNITIKYPKETPEYDCLLISNDHYKFLRFVTPDTGRKTYCTKTFRSPTFGGPITKMVLVNREDGKKKGKKGKDEQEVLFRHQKKEKNPQVLAYCTDEQVVGLILLPLDGNPNKMMGCVAHSGEILDFCCSYDGKYLFTAGGVDHTVNQWKIDHTVLEAKTKNHDGIESFFDLIEGGKEGKFFQDIKQYFFYAQIKSQGEVTTNERRISGEVEGSEIPFILRALGFYATEYEVKNLMNELKSILKDENELVDFNTFVKLYVNHKPIYMIDENNIKQAFELIGAKKNSGSLSMQTLFKNLTTRGEKMSEEELLKCLKVLLGKNFSMDDFPDFMNAKTFSKKVLGIE